MRKIILFSVTIMLLQSIFVPVFADGRANQESSSNISVEQEKEVVMNSIKEQLKEQGRLDHLHFYEAEVDRRLGINESLNNYNGLANDVASLKASKVKASNGGVTVDSNSYATTTCIYIPNNMIDKEIANSSDGIVGWVINLALGPNRCCYWWFNYYSN